MVAIILPGEGPSFLLVKKERRRHRAPWGFQALGLQGGMPPNGKGRLSDLIMSPDSHEIYAELQLSGHEGGRERYVRQRSERPRSGINELKTN